MGRWGGVSVGGKRERSHLSPKFDHTEHTSTLKVHKRMYPLVEFMYLKRT